MIWPIPSEGNLSQLPFDHHRYWVDSHEKNYVDVFSVTQDYGLRLRVTDLLREYVGAAPSKFLVPGCGTQTVLERHLIEAFPTCSIVATDFDEVVEMAASRLVSSRVEYISRDSRRLDFPPEFDAAIVVNSVLSGEDSDNRLALSAIRSSLRDNGYIIGLFPTAFATLDIGYCVPGEEERLKAVDPRTSRVHESSQGHSQIFYTPLRLNVILREAGFDDVRMEIFFCDSVLLRTEAERIYHLRGHGVVLYELLVVARKRPSSERPAVR